MDMREFLGAAPRASSLDISLPGTGVADHDKQTELAKNIEPTNEELRRQEYGGIDSWFFEGTNLEQALQKVFDKDIDRAEELFKSLEGQVHIGGLVLQGDGSDSLVTDTLHPAQVKLLLNAKIALEHIFGSIAETDNNSRGISRSAIAVGGTALGTAAGLVAPAVIPELAAMSTYGPVVGGIAGGIAFGIPLARGIWDRWQVSSALKKRGEECAEIVEGLQQKILNNTDAIRISNDWFDDIDLKKIKKSRDPDFLPFVEVVEKHQDSIRSHTKKVGEAILAKIRGEYYDRKGKRRSKDELWFNPHQASVQILQKLDEVNSSLPMEVWQGIDGQTDMKSIMRRISGTTSQLLQLDLKEDVVLGIDDDAKHQRKDDVETSRHFNARRAELKKQQTLAILEFIRLRQFVMRELSPAGSGLVSPATWPAMQTSD